MLNQSFATCLNNLRVKLEEEQLYINDSLEKLREKKENITELRIGLDHKSKELKQKEKLANLKL